MACTVDESSNLSDAISDIVIDLVAQDDANLGKVMSLMIPTAVTEYHSTQPGSTCVRQRQILNLLQNFPANAGPEQSAFLEAQTLFSDPS